jgi:hypothetical protein
MKKYKKNKIMFIMGNRRKKSKYSKYNESGGL